jgi:hypothetical protein
MAPPKKTLSAAHTIISLNVLATGRLLLTTENRVYELVNNVWTPMVFADDEPEAEPDPTPAPTPEPLPESGTAAEVQS